MKGISIKAFAKVNLGLRVLDKRHDGYHNIETYLQTISLYDRLDISLEAQSIILTSDNPELPLDENNLCYMAADRILQRIGQKQGIKIRINKNIPVGGGLGGGSSDAASVLTGLNLLLSLNLDRDEMREIALSIGSDVPFFIDGGTAFVSGRGEKVNALDTEPYFDFLVVFPDFGIDTEWAYSRIKFLTKRGKYIRIPNCNFGARDVEGIEIVLTNDFEEVMLKEHEKLRKIRQFLIQNGAASVSLSGSGSSIYGIYDDLKKMETSFNCLSEEGYWVRKVHTIKSSEIPQFIFID